MTSGFYMHENGMDCCLEIMRIQYSDSKRVIIKARWWNLGYSGNPWPIFPQFETVKIKAEDRPKWKNITHLMNIPRKKSGLPE